MRRRTASALQARVGLGTVLWEDLFISEVLTLWRRGRTKKQIEDELRGRGYTVGRTAIAEVMKRRFGDDLVYYAPEYMPAEAKLVEEPEVDVARVRQYAKMLFTEAEIAARMGLPVDLVRETLEDTDNE